MSISFRRAAPDDLPEIVALLADDPLGATREDASDVAAYRRAFDAITADPNQLLAVVEEADVVIGTLQITYVPGLSHKGALRGQIEAVRVAAAHRDRGLGREMIEWAIAQCRARGCKMVQLTSTKTRTEARRFYERIGFVASHEGFKLAL